MGIRVSATQAAALVGRHERIVRGWIAAGKLRAEPAGPRGKVEGSHTGPSRWAIDVDELAKVPGITIDRERLAAIEAGQGHTAGGMLARIEQLEREIHAMRARLRALELGSRTPETPETLASIASALDDSPSSMYSPAEMYSPADASLPARPLRASYAPRQSASIDRAATMTAEGDMPLSAFAEAHGVNRTTAIDHARADRFPTYRRANPARPTERPHYLTREGQRAAIAFWQAHYRGYRSCGDPACACAEPLAE